MPFTVESMGAFGADAANYMKHVAAISTSDDQVNTPQFASILRRNVQQVSTAVQGGNAIGFKAFLEACREAVVAAAKVAAPPGTVVPEAEPA